MDLHELVKDAPMNIRNQFVFAKYTKGSFIIFPHEENSSLYILTKGNAEVFKQNSNGSMISIYLYCPYSCFGELEIFNKEIKTLGVIAKTYCEVIKIPKNALLEWMRADFNFNLYVIEQISAKLILSTDIMARVVLLSVKDRVLCSIFAHCKMGDLKSLSKKTLCFEACVPIRSLNRAISQCISEKYIGLNDGEFSVSSIERLDKYLEGKYL